MFKALRSQITWPISILKLSFFIEGSSEYDKREVETEIQLNVVSSMLDFMKKSRNTDYCPAVLS
jgi:hypothetical protein